jgi:hypothetical protein
MHLANATNLDRNPGGKGHPEIGSATYRAQHHTCFIEK